MSLCALKYNYEGTFLTSPTDLVNIINVESELYTALLRDKHIIFMSYLHKSKHTTQLFRFNIVQVILVMYMEVAQYILLPVCLLMSAFQNLIRENFSSFILTIGCITVSIYVTTNGIIIIIYLILML